jgi:hypothetical protein
MALRLLLAERIELACPACKSACGRLGDADVRFIVRNLITSAHL